MTETAPRRHLRVVPDVELPELRPIKGTWHEHFGWQSTRYPRTNDIAHAVKLLRYPPNGNVDEWVDHGEAGAPAIGETS